MTSPVSDIKRWVANHRATNARVRTERRLLSPAASLRKALQIGELQRQMASTPQPTSIDETLQVHRRWAKLRAALLPAE